MKSILVLMCLCFTVVSSVYYEPLNRASKKAFDFVSYFVGDFDNKAQTEKPGDDHDLLEARLIPVDIKCLRPNPVVFVEETVNNVLRYLVVVVVTDGIDDTIKLTILNFTDYTKYKPREFKVESLYNISCGDLQGDRDCISSYRISSDGFIYGNFPYCSYTVNGKHPIFTCMHKCDSVTSTLPMYSQQASPEEPYELLLARKKYRLINPPEGYVSPCSN